MSTTISWPVIGGSSYSVPSSAEEDWPDLSDFLIALATAQGTAAQKTGMRIATTSPVTVATADCTVICKLTVPAAVAVTLPAGVSGQYYVIADGTGDAATNNITITPNGVETIDGAATLVLSQNYQAVTIAYNGAGNWIITSSHDGGSSGGGSTGTGLLVRQTSPTLITPTLGVASATSINKLSITAPATSATLAVADGKTFTASNTLTLTGTDGTSFAFPGTSDTVVTLAATQTLTNKRLTTPGINSAVAMVTDSDRLNYLQSAGGTTGSTSSNVVFSTSPTIATATLNSPTMVTPALGTPASGVLTNCTGYPAGSISGLGANVATWLATPTSANLRTAVATTSTGTGDLVFGTSPSFTTPSLGVATATSINKLTITAPATSATLAVADGGSLSTSGAFGITLTATALTNVTLPTSGTLVNSAVTTLSSLTTVGALASGSIASGFGTINTANNIGTSALLFTSNTTDATSSTDASAALRTAGGLAVAKKIYVGTGAYISLEAVIANTGGTLTSVPLTIGGSTTSQAGGRSQQTWATVDTSTSAARNYVSWSQGGVNKALIGVEGDTNGLITGGTQNQMAIAGNVINFSGDFGTTRHGNCGSTGAWVFGPSSGLTSAHTMRNSSTSDHTLNIRNTDTTSSSDDNSPLYIEKGSTTNTTSQILVQFAVNAGSTGQGQINGNGAGAAAFGSFSDASLKENIQTLPSQLQKIMALRPVEFDYKDGSGHQIGYIAQEMVDVYPDAVGSNREGTLIISGWDKTSARLVKAIQELKAEIDQLKGTR